MSVILKAVAPVWTFSFMEQGNLL